MRRLPPYRANIGKRLVKSPKVYVRDSGLVHALLGIEGYQELAGHPVVGPSWEGFVIENLLVVAPERTKASFYRTAVGAEIDLVLEWPGRKKSWAVEIKRSLTAKPARGFYHAREDLQPTRSFVVYAGQDRYPIAEGVEAISLPSLMQELLQLNEEITSPV